MLLIETKHLRYLPGWVILSMRMKHISKLYISIKAYDFRNGKYFS